MVVMKGSEILKWGFAGLLGYSILKELNQPANNHGNVLSGNHSNPVQIPQLNRIGLTKQDLESIWQDAFNKTFQKPNLLILPPAKPSPDLNTIEAGKWLRVISHPSIVIILGKRGSGKSASGYRLLEHLRWTASPYVVGLPKEARILLPDWIGMAASLEDVPPKAIALVDEAYMPYHARSSMAAEAKVMSQLVNLSRQREQTLIFVSQEARQIDRNIASSANVVIFKDLGILQLKFDRRELNDIATQAKQAFSTINGDKRRSAFVHAPDSDFIGLVENSLPTFWRDKLSHVFATGGEVTARAPKKTTLDKKIEKAKELKRQGLSLGQIAKLLGVTKQTIKNYLENYPYRA